MKQTLIDIAWFVIGAVVMWDIASGEMGGWEWFMFIWATLATGHFLSMLMARWRDALFAYLDRKQDEDAA